MELMSRREAGVEAEEGGMIGMRREEAGAETGTGIETGGGAGAGIAAEVGAVTTEGAGREVPVGTGKGGAEVVMVTGGAGGGVEVEDEETGIAAETEEWRPD